MYNSEWVAGVAIAALLLGLLLGVVLGRSSFPGRKAKDLEEELEASRKALEDYRSEVYDQFAETARKFETLNSSYNDLHRHLASSASTLLGDGGGAPLLKGPTEDPLPAAAGETIDGDAAPVEAETAPELNDAHSTEAAATDAEAESDPKASAEATPETSAETTPDTHAPADGDVPAEADAAADAVANAGPDAKTEAKSEPDKS